MTDNQSASDGLRELLKLVELAKVNTAPLEQALQQHVLHQEGAESQGVLLVNEGVTFVDKVTRYGGVSVFRDDSHTHTILNSRTIDDLTNQQFLSSPPASLRNTAKTGLHELLHAMVFRSRCFNGSNAQEEELVGANLVNDISMKISSYLALVGGNLSLAHSIYEQLTSDIPAKLKKQKRWAACYNLLGLPGAFPAPFLAFTEGNPGVPGDGAFVDESAGQLPTEFEMLVPFSLAQAINGITLSAFAPPGVSISGIPFSVENLSLPNSNPCRLKVFATGTPALPESFLFEGVEGSFVNVPQGFLDEIVAFANLVRPGCVITLSDLSVVTIQVETSIETLDAATISLGLDALP